MNLISSVINLFTLFWVIIKLKIIHPSCYTCNCHDTDKLHVHYEYIPLVRFRFIVFRPFIDEIIVGKIKSSSPEGVRGI